MPVSEAIHCCIVDSEKQSTRWIDFFFQDDVLGTRRQTSTKLNNKNFLKIKNRIISHNFSTYILQ